MNLLVVGFCLAAVAALTYLEPTPLKVGCLVLTGAMFLVVLSLEGSRR